MEVILNQDVRKLGKAGSVVKVKDGFARNFLIPKGMAVPSTQAGLREIELKRQKNLADLQKAKAQAQQLKERLQQISLTIPVLTQEQDSLYGSVTALDICNALKEEGIEIDKDSIQLEEPVRALGIYEIPVSIHPEVSAKLKIWIVKK
jgi:large subunit ribosomal protein L9